MVEHKCLKETQLSNHQTLLERYEECVFPKLNQTIEGLRDSINNPSTGILHRVTQSEACMENFNKQIEKLPKQILTGVGIMMGILIVIATASFYVSWDNSKAIQTYIMTHQEAAK